MAIEAGEETQPRVRAELAAALGRELRGDVRADAYTRHLYAGDASMYAREPLLVAFPHDAGDVAAAIAIAGRFDVPVVTRGGGTSLAGQAVGGRGIVLDTSRHMDAIGEIDSEARRLRVGPGVVQEDLNRAAQPFGLGFGPDTATANRATIGGMIGNNSSGSHSIVHGTTIDHVYELDDALELGAAAVEMIDRTILELSRSRLEYRRLSATIDGDPAALLFVTFFGDSVQEASHKLDRLEAAWRTHGHGYHTLRAETRAEQAALTKVRTAGLGLLMAAGSGARRPLAFVEDTAVAPERLNDYVAQLEEILDRHSLTAGWYGHASVGCLHIRPFVDLTEPGGIETMVAVAEEVVALVAEFGGVNSSEHGDGRVRSPFNPRIFGDDLYEAMRRTKALFDPHNRLNPGVIVDAAAITADLRDPALPPPGPLVTRLSFADHGGMRGAADRCQRIGACRKTGSGVMCPSYMATREEEHATRGRANALVMALSQPDPKAALGDERLHEILDLCLECKACKSECPLSVDMASLKAEFLSHYQDRRGVPVRSRLFGSIRRLNRLGAATAPLSNLPGRAPPLRAVLERTAGIDRRRPLPQFRRETLVRWHRHHRAPFGTRGELVFLADSFTTFTEPAVGRAAIELLEAAGWTVRLHSAGCCGRASISKGLLDQARAMAAGMAERLAPYARRGVPIVGCEPSCLLTLRDEHLKLLPGDPRAQVVAAQARLVEELLVEAIDDGSLGLDPGSPVAGSRIVLHGHCHQKALVGTAATVALLERIPGAEVVELDAGCCGMAGSFGFEAEHYELSMQIGETRLFPALRGEQTGTVIAATGVSCRQQIAHGVGREARHPVQIVRAAL